MGLKTRLPGTQFTHFPRSRTACWTTNGKYRLEAGLSFHGAIMTLLCLQNRSKLTKVRQEYFVNMYKIEQSSKVSTGIVLESPN